MSSNKAVKNAMIERYGNKCFIERLHLRDTKGIKYTGCNQYKKMKMLTYHHIKMKSQGGKATIENGALLSAENHQWFHQQSRQQQKIMNNMFQELKRKIDHKECRVEITDDVSCPFEVEFIELYIDDKSKLNIQEIKSKEKRKQRTEMQKMKKEWEDR